MNPGTHAAIFRSGTVRQLVEHARACQRHAATPAIGDYASVALGSRVIEPAPPGLHLICDLAVYLASNGLPPATSETGQPMAAFAEQLCPLRTGGPAPASLGRQHPGLWHFIPLEHVEPVASAYDRLFVKLAGGDVEIGGFNVTGDIDR